MRGDSSRHPHWEADYAGRGCSLRRLSVGSDLCIRFSSGVFFGGQTPSFTNDLLLLSAASPPPPPPPAAPPISIRGFGDVFSGDGGPFAPVEIVAIYVTSLGPGTAATSPFHPVTPFLPTPFGGVTPALN